MKTTFAIIALLAAVLSAACSDRPLGRYAVNFQCPADRTVHVAGVAASYGDAARYLARGIAERTCGTVNEDLIHFGAAELLATN